MEKVYIAHAIRNASGKIEKIQTVKEHLEGTAKLAAQFAKPFGADEIAHECGLGHDIGKYTDKFQHRILDNGPAVDHSTAGAKELFNVMGILPAYCAAGHHAGLPDGGGRYDTSESSATLYGRLNKHVEDYGAFQTEIVLHKTNAPSLKMLGKKGFTCSFFIRMLFSCLVDADFLDTEAFMKMGTVERKAGESIETLTDKLDAYITDKKLLRGTNRINEKRSEILRFCIEKGRQSERGLYTLTVPTGGGKTISSLSFALHHAFQHKMQRVIYVIPYCSIIDQTVSVFENILGNDNVLAHFSEAQYDDDNKELMEQKRLASENWDVPVIVTTAVQFFESLFSNKTSSCRKLHNIADSVVVFDEAQTLPFDYLKPCVDTIAELAVNYKTTCVLCTATQPALQDLFHEYAPNLKIQEINPDTKGLYQFFRRVTYRKLGVQSDKEITGKLMNLPQVLCIVSTKSQAKNLFDLLEGEGVYHLSTFMTSEHRREILQIIRERLKSMQTCRVVSTSLIEAGVDLDFPVVFRACAGLDNEIQAGGRCNREGKQKAEDSMVYIFKPESKYKMPDSMRRPSEEMEIVTRDKEDIAAEEVIEEYFQNLYHDSGDVIDKKQIVAEFEEGFRNRLSFPFATAAKEFHMIDDYSKTVLIPRNTESRELANQLERGLEERNRELFRKMGKFCVSITPRQFDEIRPALNIIDESVAILEDLNMYDEKTGLKIKFEGGQGEIL